MILWFSGTGNSYIVANFLAKEMGERIQPMSLTDDVPIDLTTEKRIIWVMPVHSWGMPKAVAEHLQRVEITGAERAEHYLVMTCGDDAGLTAQRWRKAMNQRNWKAMSAYTVEMPNTYVLLPGFDTDSNELATTKLKNSVHRIEEIIAAIKNGSEEDSVIKGSFAWLKTYIIYPLFMRFMMSAKPFHATDKCVSCGLCKKICPLNNIILDPNTRKPQWSMNCTQCLGCYHVCPHNAIKYGKATDGKGQWRVAIKNLLSSINNRNLK